MQMANTKIHIVGIGIDPEHNVLDSLLLKQRQNRKLRVEKINNLLVKSNIDGLMSYLASQKAMSITRSHVADFLVLSGATKNRKSAFTRFLGKVGELLSLRIGPPWRKPFMQSQTLAESRF